MKKFLGLLLAGAVSVSFAANIHHKHHKHHKHVKHVKKSHKTSSAASNIESKVYSLPYQSVSEEEKNMLINLRQEEKVARDVYLTLYNKYHARVFSNIAKAEQTHMDAVKALLDKYGIADPIAGKEDKVGAFADETFTNLYNQLVAEGNISYLDSLIVGATIEDMDIHDLDDDMANTDNEDFEYVFTKLRTGSTHHLNAFVYNLNKQGYEYTPQYISLDEYNSIVNQ